MPTEMPDRTMQGPAARRGDLRPDQIVARRFRWALFGVSRAEVRRFAAEVAGAVAGAREALAREVADQIALRKSLEDARRRLAELEANLAATQRELARHRHPEEPAPAGASRTDGDAPAGAEPALPAGGHPRAVRRRTAHRRGEGP